MKEVKEYLKECEIKDILPSEEGFVIFLMEKYSKKYPNAVLFAGEYKGLITTNAISFLKNKASSGSRNSFVYIQLLKEMREAGETKTNDKVIINIDLNDKSGKKL